MNKIFEKPVLFLLILTFLCGYLFFLGSGRMALTDPDETFYAQTAKEMVARHEWATPYLYGKPQFEKPIMFYWLVEASYGIFGVNEFAARFPSAVFGLLGVIAMYFLGALLFSKRSGMLSAVILAVNVEYVILSRACVTDMVLSTFMISGALFFFYGYLKKKDYFYILSAASFALATLTKGPVAILLAGAIVFIYLFLAKDLKALKKMPVMWMVLAFIAVAAPWYLLVYKLHGKAFIDAFFGFHNVTRFLQAEHKIGSQFYYNIPIILGGFFPWSVFLPVGLWSMFKKSRSRKPEDRNEKNHSIFVLVWLFMIFIFFSISSTKLPTYIFPSFMSLALITGVFWDDFLKGLAQKNIVKQMTVSYYVLLAVVVVGAIGALLYINYDYPVVLKGVFVSSIFLISGMALSLVAFLNKKFLWVFFLIVYSVAVFLLPLGALVLPEIERYETSKEISQKLLSLMKPDEKLGSESNHLAGLAFYTGKFPVDIDKHQMMVELLNSEKTVWCVMKEKNHRQLYDPKVNTDYVKPSYTVYGVGKRTIVTNELPRDGKYITKRERSR